jgi:hypothetical protein
MMNAERAPIGHLQVVRAVIQCPHVGCSGGIVAEADSEVMVMLRRLGHDEALITPCETCSQLRNPAAG